MKIRPFFAIYFCRGKTFVALAVTTKEFTDKDSRAKVFSPEKSSNPFVDFIWLRHANNT